MPDTTPDIAPDELARLRNGVRIMALHELGEMDTAEEVAQETMARVLLALQRGRVDDPGHLGAFVRGVARHVIVDVMRARRREVPLDDAAMQAPASPAADPLEALVTAEQHRMVSAALALLSPADRELLKLTFFECATSEDVSRRLGEPAARIRKRKERALERLRNAVASLSRHTRPVAPTGLHTALRRAGVPKLSVE